MKRTRLWRTATAGMATAALLTLAAGPAAAQLEPITDPLEEALDPVLNPGDGTEEGDPEGGTGGDADADADATTDTTAGAIPEAGVGGFAGYANAAGASVFVGLPAELAEGLAPLLEGLGIAGSSPVEGSDANGILIDLARVETDLERAAAGEDISSEASAFVTNLLLASGEADEPGACSGGPMEISLPPDDPAPILTLTVAGVECEESDERAFANVKITGLYISLANLIAQGDEEGQLRDGLNQILDPLNEGLAESNQLLCPVLEGIGLTAENCEEEAPILQVANPLDLDVPLVDLDLVEAAGEVTQDGESITATASSSVAGLNLVGVVCEDQLHTSTATSDGTTATRSASVSPLNVETCNTEQTLIQLLLDGEPIGDIGVVDSILQSDLFDGSAEPLFDGIDQLADALSTTLVTSGSANEGPIDGAGTTASTSPFVVVRTLAFSELDDSPLGDIEVVVAGGSTAVGVNALPAGVQPPAPPEQPVTPAAPGDPAPPTRLPRTGAGAGALLGLAALGAAAALRRRDS